MKRRKKETPRHRPNVIATLAMTKKLDFSNSGKKLDYMDINIISLGWVFKLALSPFPVR